MRLEELHPREADCLLHSERATIEVFDVAGRRLLSRELHDFSAGHHSLQLQEHMASGLYLLRLKQGAETVVGRTVVLK